LSGDRLYVNADFLLEKIFCEKFSEILENIFETLTKYVIIGTVDKI